MKIVITGITGFIGKNLLKIIADDENQYICLVRKSSNVGCLVKASNIEYRVIDWSQQENLRQCGKCRCGDSYDWPDGRLWGDI